MKNTTAMANYELRHIEALRKDLAGCTVLLKKDGSFPLEKPCTLAAYGSGVRRTIRGGTGSGEVNSRYIVTIEEGLQQAGFTLTGMEWHTGYEQAREKAHKAFLKQLKKDAKAAKQNFILYGMGKVMPELNTPCRSTLRAMQQFTLFPAFPVRATTARHSRATSA